MKKGKALFKLLPILFLALFLSISCVSAAEDTNTDQTENNLYNDSCGPIALQKTLKTQGKTVTVDKLAEQSGTDDEGTTMQGMINTAKKYGVELYGVESKANKLQKGNIAILDTDKGYHYSVITEINNETITLHNPPETISLNKFEEVYSGYALTTKLNQGRLLNSQELQTIKGSDLWQDAQNTVNNAANTVKKGIQRIKQAHRDITQKNTEINEGVMKRLGL